MFCAVHPDSDAGVTLQRLLYLTCVVIIYGYNITHY